MDSGRNKRFRSTVHKVDEHRLFYNLSKIAGTEVPWAWDGSHFGKPNKACGPDHGLLALSVPLLNHLITEASNGFPDARGVSRVLQSLHLRHSIFDGSDLIKEKGLSGCCLDAADSWKKMLYELVLMKRANTRVANPDLQLAVDSIVLQRPDPQQYGIAAREVPIHDEDVPAWQEDPTDDVEFVSERCNCSKCRKGAVHEPLVAVPVLALGGVQDRFGTGIGHDGDDDDDVMMMSASAPRTPDAKVAVAQVAVAQVANKQKKTKQKQNKQTKTTRRNNTKNNNI